MNKIKFSRLEKWGNKLDACIRCGYCYEHCHIYKKTRWESDAPRGKLIMLYGLMNGDIQPSDYVAEKVFECFNCKRCTANCSASLPITEIFEDARADLVEAGFDVKGTTSVTNNGRCMKCLECVRLCKHEARYYDGVIVTDIIKCQSCGVCMDSCPRIGITMNKGYGTGKSELQNEIAGFLNNENKKNAKIIVLSCSWSTYPDLQNSELVIQDDDPEYKIFVTVCSGRIQSELIWDAFGNGAWGVLVTGCPDDDCEHEGIHRTRSRVAMLKDKFEKVGINPGRVKLETVEKGNPNQMKEEISKFITEINEIGPL